MVNLKLEKQHLPYNAPLVVHCKIIKRFLLTAITLFQPKGSSQLSGDKFDQVAEQIILIKPKDFSEQTAVIDRIQDYTEKNFGLIIIDTFTSLYGAKVAESSGKAFSVNRELNRQLAILAQTAKITKNPSYHYKSSKSVFDDQTSVSRPLQHRVLKFWADTIIAHETNRLPSNNQSRS